MVNMHDNYTKPVTYHKLKALRPPRCHVQQTLLKPITALSWFTEILRPIAYQCICHHWAMEICCCCCCCHWWCCWLRCWQRELAVAKADLTKQAPTQPLLPLLLKWTFHCPLDCCWLPSSCSFVSFWAVKSKRCVKQCFHNLQSTVCCWGFFVVVFFWGVIRFCKRKWVQSILLAYHKHTVIMSLQPNKTPLRVYGLIIVTLLHTDYLIVTVQQ